MQANHTTLPAMSRADLARLVEILSPYRGEPLTPTVMALALQILSMEATA